MLWLVSAEVSYNSLAEATERIFSNIPLPQEVWLVGLDGQRRFLAEMGQRLYGSDGYREATQFYSPPDLRVATLDDDGVLFLQAGAAFETVDEADKHSLFRVGMASMFGTHGGLLESAGGYHYIRPGGSHGDAFLRTANALVDGFEVDFVAAALHSRLGRASLSRIYTDSASINVVAYALVRLRERFGIPVQRTSIRSFGGYPGLRKGYEFDADADSIALISASASGAMFRRLTTAHGFADSSVFTLFYVANDPGIGVLCDLTDRGSSDQAGFIPPIRSWRRDESCALCKAGQSTVELVGDQFLPANPTTSSLTLRAKERPVWLEHTMKAIRGRRVIRIHSGDMRSGVRARTIRLQLSELFSGSGFFADESLYLRQVLERVIDKGVPAAVTTIVHFDDDDSKLFANACLDRIARYGLDVGGIRVMSVQELLRTPPSEHLAEGVALVVGSAIASGRTVLSVSRALRTVHADRAITYLLFMPRMSSGRAYSQLKSNLRYGKFGPEQFEVYAGHIVEMPLDARGGSLWDEERDLWSQIGSLDSEVLQLSEGDRALIARRESILDSALTSGGLEDECFLPTFNTEFADGILRLRPGFAFWNDDYEGEAISQADVFFTISAVLHFHRERAVSRGTEHNWVVLDPQNFHRYNDGVIQASLLRSAEGQELDYSSDTDRSWTMLDLLRGMLNSWDQQEGEAVAEFLLAMASSRMRLESSVERSFLQFLDEAVSLPPLLELLARYVRAALGASRP